MSQSYPQQGVGGMDLRYLRRDGSVPLSDVWDVGGHWIRALSVLVDSGGLLALGDFGGQLRVTYEGAEIVKIMGESNSEGELLQKNATMTDLAGVGVRAVLADVNGKLSAP